MYKLRPHHGLCIQLFRGRGYSEEFVAHMIEFIEILQNNPEIELFPDCDVLCQHCPHKTSEERCGRYEKVLGLDNNVLNFLNLEPHQTFLWEDFKNLVKEQILDAGELEHICKGCSWLDFCLKNNRPQDE